MVKLFSLYATSLKVTEPIYDVKGGLCIRRSRSSMERRKRKSIWLEAGTPDTDRAGLEFPLVYLVAMGLFGGQVTCVRLSVLTRKMGI